MDISPHDFLDKLEREGKISLFYADEAPKDSSGVCLTMQDAETAIYILLKMIKDGN